MLLITQESVKNLRNMKDIFKTITFLICMRHLASKICNRFNPIKDKEAKLLLKSLIKEA